ncbi:MAG: hypothetical protein KAT58_09820 [candidate division Zixibacteria bacterium]|nr:hypothetical protein [candidate division Zixibacteria bacterium]
MKMLNRFLALFLALSLISPVAGVEAKRFSDNTNLDTIPSTFEFVGNEPGQNDKNATYSLTSSQIRDDLVIGDIPDLSSLYLATGGLSNNLVYVNSVDDLPTPVAGVITLVDNTNYRISGAVNLGTDRLTLGENNAVYAGNRFAPLITYTGTGSLFTGVDKHFQLSNVAIDCPNDGQVYDLSCTPSSGGKILYHQGVTVFNCGNFGTFDDMDIVNINNSSALNCKHGFIIQGTTNWTFFGITKVALTSTNTTFKGIDLNNSVHQTFELSNLVLRAPAGAIGIEGLANSANISSGNLAVVTNGEFSGGLTPTSGITNSDIRWKFKDNAGICDTTQDVLLAFVNNALETTIVTINVPVVVNAVWTVERSSKFTGTSAGKATCDAEREAIYSVDLSLGLVSVGGGALDVTMYLAKDGIKIDGSAIKLTISGTVPQNASIPWQLSLDEIEYVEVMIANNTSTINVIAEYGKLRIK